MLRLLNNLQFFKVNIEEVITVALSFIVTFTVDLYYICRFQKFLTVARDVLLKSFLGLLSFPFLPLFWLSIVAIECLMEHIKAPPAILQTPKFFWFAKKHYEYVRLSTFNDWIWTHAVLEVRYSFCSFTSLDMLKIVVLTSLWNQSF